ncbi:MAG: hypothetical protein JNJ54_34915 [Myxococcaceae bacterium]|nr:hypothetical protein [Myxococcaceae bacterium]
MRYLAVMLLVGCGGLSNINPPPEPPKTAVRVENDYAESLFTVGVQVNDGGVVELMKDKRIGANQSASAPFVSNVGDVVTLHFSAMSLGQRQNFTPIVEKDPVTREKPTLLITYDFDLATANFTIRHYWTY